ncbi:CD276 antigen homolog [Oreochromis aureus]|uniref:CD276 antigen homolog n=1 Tax=Oreochromis aureus TaxID=47969 RepID=UPI0019531D0B|nr:CD276 antigen homolog [Oreochromis aureus]
MCLKSVLSTRFIANILTKMAVLLGLFSALLFVSEAIFVYNVNSTVMDSALLECSVPVKTDLKNLRFYWQDERNYVLYSFNKGKTMFNHVNDPYLNRVSAFTQDMTKGNISVLVKNLTLGDNGRIFEAYAAVFNGSKTVMQNSKVCHVNLYVTVPYKDLKLAVNTKMMTSVCTLRDVFPAPEIHWTIHYNHSESLVDSKYVHTKTEQDPENYLYTSSSTLHIPAGPYRAITCLCHNPTSNTTLNATYTLSKGAAVWSLPGWSAGLIVAAAVLLTALMQL